MPHSEVPPPGDSREQREAEAVMVAILCEAWAHQGPPKEGQRHKVLTDAFKLSFAASVVGHSPRMILLFCDEAAATPFRESGWAAAALRERGIEVEVVQLPDELRERIRAAQTRQFR